MTIIKRNKENHMQSYWPDENKYILEKFPQSI